MISITKTQKSGHFHAPDSQQLSVRRCRKTKMPPGFVYITNATSDQRLIFLLQGEATLWLGNREITLKKHDCLFLPHYTGYRLIAGKDTETVTVSFDFRGSLAFSEELYAFFKGASELKEPFLQLCDLQLFESTLVGANEAAVLLLLNRLNTLFGSDNAKMALYRKCCLWAEDNAHRAATVKELAEEMGYSAEHLNRIMRLFGSANASEMLIQKRIEKIKFFASEGCYSVAELAQLLGFYTPELLRKFFRYHTGRNLTELLKKRNIR